MSIETSLHALKHEHALKRKKKEQHVKHCDENSRITLHLWENTKNRKFCSSYLDDMCLE